MIVVSDTSPLNYLVLLGHQDILPRLFGEVFVPPAVVNELRHARTPEPVKAWVSAPPAWLRVRAPVNPLHSMAVDRGEADAIALAEELRADAILIDDNVARLFAEGRGLKVRGTLGVLLLAGEMGFLDATAALDRLQRTNFRASPERFAEIRRLVTVPRVKYQSDVHGPSGPEPRGGAAG